MADKDKDDEVKESKEEKELRLQGEAQAVRESAARGHALTSDRVVDRPQ
jgi:hypothetical protein